MRSGFALAVIAASVFSAAPASAQYYRYQRPAYTGPDYYAPARGGFYCQKLCPMDVTPCDPPEYKRADGRCANPGGGNVR